MTTPSRLSYSAAAQSARSQEHGLSQPTYIGSGSQTVPAKTTPSPSHVPKNTSQDEALYVVTLLTDRAHHARMTELRRKYFPKALNKLAAHLTLFHALPGSKLESSIHPHLEQVAQHTARFRIEASKPFRLKKGIAISVHDQGRGGRDKQSAQSAGQQVHQALQSRWADEGFLSDQDAGGCRLHYTVMNKVDDEDAIRHAFEEMTASWKGDYGTAEGLALWRYDRGFWRWERKFAFQKQTHADVDAVP